MACILFGKAEWNKKIFFPHRHGQNLTHGAEVELTLQFTCPPCPAQLRATASSAAAVRGLILALMLNKELRPCCLWLRRHGKLAAAITCFSMLLFQCSKSASQLKICIPVLENWLLKKDRYGMQENSPAYNEWVVSCCYRRNFLFDHWLALLYGGEFLQRGALIELVRRFLRNQFFTGKCWFPETKILRGNINLNKAVGRKTCLRWSEVRNFWGARTSLSHRDSPTI